MSNTPTLQQEKNAEKTRNGKLGENLKGRSINAHTFCLLKKGPVCFFISSVVRLFLAFFGTHLSGLLLYLLPPISDLHLPGQKNPENVLLHVLLPVKRQIRLSREREHELQGIRKFDRKNDSQFSGPHLLFRLKRPFDSQTAFCALFLYFPSELSQFSLN